MKLIKSVLKIVSPARQNKKERITKEMKEFSSALKGVHFAFREGFSDRLMARFDLLLEEEPLVLYYNNLSRLFPKIAGFSFAAILIMGLILFALHGSLSPDEFLGADRIDETNFISYLILHK